MDRTAQINVRNVLGDLVGSWLIDSGDLSTVVGWFQTDRLRNFTDKGYEFGAAVAASILAGWVHTAKTVAPGLNEPAAEYLYTLFLDGKVPQLTVVRLGTPRGGLIYTGSLYGAKVNRDNKTISHTQITYNPTAEVVFTREVVKPGTQSPKVAKHRDRFRNPQPASTPTHNPTNPNGYKYQSPRTGKWIQYPYNGR
jgi:hypothetical protein